MMRPHESRLLGCALALVLAACGGTPDGDGVDDPVDDAGPADDTTPPSFAGVETATVTGPDAVTLTWQLATDASPPIRYEVYLARASGEQDFIAPPALVVEDVATVTIDGLDTTVGVFHHFVVRARDAADNADANRVERVATFTPSGLQFVAHLPMPGASSDIAVHEDGWLVAIGGLSTGDTYLIDASSPGEPRLITAITGQNYQGDVEFSGDTLYVSREFANDAVGMLVYDVSAPGSPQLVGELRPGNGLPSGVGHCHNITIHEDRDLLHCASSQDGDLHVFSTGGPLGGTPAQPAYLTSIGLSSGIGVHDSFGRGDRLYVAFLNRGLRIYDVSDPTAPVEIGAHDYPNSFTHNVWPSDDGKFLFATDERSNVNTDGMRVFDISDLGAIEQVANFETDTVSAIIHNVEVEGRFAYISYYVDGLRVVDIDDPRNPSLAGAFDTFDGPDDSGFAGAFGVQAVPPFVYVSDINTGLYVFTFQPEGGAR